MFQLLLIFSACMIVASASSTRPRLACTCANDQERFVEFGKQLQCAVQGPFGLFEAPGTKLQFHRKRVMRRRVLWRQFHGPPDGRVGLVDERLILGALLVFGPPRVTESRPRNRKTRIGGRRLFEERDDVIHVGLRTSQSATTLPVGGKRDATACCRVHDGAGPIPRS